LIIYFILKEKHLVDRSIIHIHIWDLLWYIAAFNANASHTKAAAYSKAKQHIY